MHKEKLTNVNPPRITTEPEYNTRGSLLDDYYRQCGRDWGNVGLALEIARTSGKHMRDICHYYKRYRKWNRVLIEIGIRPGSDYYNPFYDRIDFHSRYWHKHYCSYCDHHDRYHHPKKYKRHKWDDDDDDDDDWDDDDD